MTKQEFIKECVVEHTAPLFDKMTADELLEWQKRWNKKRDEAYLSFDLEKIKKFIVANRIVMGIPFLPSNDKVIYASAMKVVCDLPKATKEQKQKAADWLIAHGLKPGIR